MKVSPVKILCITNTITISSLVIVLYFFGYRKYLPLVWTTSIAAIWGFDCFVDYLDFLTRLNIEQKQKAYMADQKIQEQYMKQRRNIEAESQLVERLKKEMIQFEANYKCKICAAKAPVLHTNSKSPVIPLSIKNFKDPYF